MNCLECEFEQDCCSPCGRVAGRLQWFLDSSEGYAALPRRKYTPSFRLEPLEPGAHAAGTQWFYICDGNERIGLVQDWTKEIELFRFFPAGAGAAQREIPEVYHWANLIGARIQMYGTQMLPPVTSFRLVFTKDCGSSLEFRVEHSHEGGIDGTGEYQLTWDERLGYVWNCLSRYSMRQPVRVEFNNLFAGGVAESRDARKRWQKTVRALADGRISFVHHNPLNVPTNDMDAGGFVGFVTEEDMNPFVELLDTSCPVVMETCGQWYDQHIVMERPLTRGADGLYHVRALYRFLSLPGALAGELEKMAVPDDTTARAVVRVGFLQNVVNDFESTVPRDRVYNGPTWCKGLRATDEFAHSGKKSLKLVGPGPGMLRTESPIGAGPPIYGESGKRYRLAAWVMTRGLHDGGAYLELDDVVFSWSDVRATRRTEKLVGDRDWHRLEIEFSPSPNDPLLLVKLCVEGTGAAWFDDLALMDVG